MFETIQTAPPDPILGLTEAFKKDPRPGKINLSVGVYQDESGMTPILQCVKQAERLLVDEETSKGYLGIAGHPDFAVEVRKLVFGVQIDSSRITTVQTPGGTGALRIAAELVRRQFPHARIWCSQPTWANHPHVFQSAGLEVQFYPYLDATGHGLDIDAMLRDLIEARPGDVICLHACCHNPSGIDPNSGQWSEIATVLRDRRLLPLVDFAYQGLGTGLSEDAEGIRILAEAGLELLVCSSYSKNFGLYAERVGALSVLADTAAAAEATLSQLKATVRANYSNPPKHGAVVVARVLTDPNLRSLWEQEVEAMRARIQKMRHLFVETLRSKGVQRDFSFLLEQRGMFSFSGLNPLQVDELQKKHGVYVVGTGRINVAGMTEANMMPLCEAIADVIGAG